METLEKRPFRLLLIGLTGVGKSRLGNKLSGNKLFIESDQSDSCTKGTQISTNQFGVEIIDSQGLEDTDDQDKEALTSIFNEIKNKKPNILVYVQNISNKRFGKSSKKVIEEMCKMFDTKSIWNHFIIVFTFSNTVSKKNRESCANNFINSILKVLKEYYDNTKVNDNLPIPNMINHYFVELGDEDDYKLDNNTINSLGDIMKQSMFTSPISNSKEKIIIEIKRKRNCQESIKKYDRMIEDEKGSLKKVASYVGGWTGATATGTALSTVGAAGLTVVGVASAPVFLGVGLVGGVIALIAQKKIFNKLDEVDFEHTVDDKYQNEDYITFDEETIIYHDGTSEKRKVNIDYFTRIISK